MSHISVRSSAVIFLSSLRCIIGKPPQGHAELRIVCRKRTQLEGSNGGC